MSCFFHSGRSRTSSARSVFTGIGPALSSAGFPPSAWKRSSITDLSQQKCSLPPRWMLLGLLLHQACRCLSRRDRPLETRCVCECQSCREEVSLQRQEVHFRRSRPSHHFWRVGDLAWGNRAAPVLRRFRSEDLGRHCRPRALRTLPLWGNR